MTVASIDVGSQSTKAVIPDDYRILTTGGIAMIAGALGAALFAYDRAQDKAQSDVAGNALVRPGAPH